MIVSTRIIVPNVSITSQNGESLSFMLWANVKCGTYLTKKFPSNRLYKNPVTCAKLSSIIGLREISGA